MQPSVPTSNPPRTKPPTKAFPLFDLSSLNRKILIFF